jgi:thiol-disulfide isomerase/thioredoxin
MSSVCRGCLFVFASIVLCVNGVNAQPNTSSHVAEVVISRLKSLHDFDITYDKIEKSIMSSTVKVTPIELRASHIDDTSRIMLWVHCPDQEVFYRDHQLTYVNPHSKSIYRDTIAESSLLSRINYLVSGTFLNRGSGLRVRVDSERQYMAVSDTTVDGYALTRIRFREPSDSTDTMIGKAVTVDYLVTENGDLFSVATFDTAFHELLYDIKHVRTFDSSPQTGLAKSIDSILADAAKNNYKETSRAARMSEHKELLAVGDQAPDFSGVTQRGDTTRLSKVCANVTMIDFWYSGCPYCRYAMPFLRKMLAKYGAQGYTMVGIDSKDDDTVIFHKAVRVENLTNPELRVSPTVDEDLFHVQLYPTFLLLDRNRKIVYEKLGYTSSFESEIEGAIVTALKDSSKAD